MASTLFGEHLKREREMRGVSLEEIAAATRISTRFLEAIENGEWEVLPGGAFNRGFIRATARYLGLNEDSMVAEYALETKDQNDSRAAVAANAAIPRDLRPLGVAVAVLLVLIAGIAFGFHRLHQIRLRKQAEAAAAAAVAPSPTADSTPQASPAGVPTSNSAAASSVSADAAQPSLQSTTPSPNPAAVPQKTEPAVLELKVQDGKSARVKVLVDGKKAFEGRLRPNAVKTFHGKDHFEVISSDTGTLSLDLNGNSIPIPSNSTGHPISLSRKDLRAPPASNP